MVIELSSKVPVEPQLAMISREHRHNMPVAQAPGFADGWMFPSSVGTLRVPSSVSKAWRRCLKLAEVGHRFTVHGLRYTFTDLVRRAHGGPKADAVVRRALTGHVTESMQDHYSTVSLDEKRTAVAGVHRFVAEVAVDNGSGDGEGPGDRKVGTRVGTGPESEKG